MTNICSEGFLRINHIWKRNDKGEEYLTQFNVTVLNNQMLIDDIHNIFNDIAADTTADGKHFPINDIYFYSYRNVTGGTSLSMHGYGIACDINVTNNCYINKFGKITVGKRWEPGSNVYSMPSDGIVVSAFKRHGWGWGGDYKSIKDYMHLSLTGE